MHMKKALIILAAAVTSAFGGIAVFKILLPKLTK